MLQNLKLEACYDGMVFLADSVWNPPSLPSHRHRELEMNLVLRGSIDYVVDGSRSRFEAGTLLWLFPAQEHQLVDRSRDAQNYVVVFKPGLIARGARGERYAALRRQKLAPARVLQTRLAAGPFDLLRRTLDGLLEGAPPAEVLNRELGFGAKSDFRYRHADPAGLNAGLQHLLLLAWRCQQGTADNPAVALHPAVRRALAFLEDAPENAGLGEIARAGGLSESHLCRLFARQMGSPLTRYRNQLRIRRFLELYRDAQSQRTLSEAAFAAGFGSYPQFYRVFREVFGRSPRAAAESRATGKTPPGP